MDTVLMSGWDIILVAVVSAMGTTVAYLRNPEHKAFVLMLPVPFSLATMAVGKPVDAANVVAMVVLFLYTIGVWFLRVRCRWPILAAIAVSAALYCLAGALMLRLPLDGSLVFWIAVPVVVGTGVSLVCLLPSKTEPHYRTPLPPWIKLPAIAAVILLLVALKRQLGGFMTMFPMVGVVAAYEARYSLWTIVRRIAWVMVLMAPMMAAIRLLQGWLGIGWAVVASWPLYLLLLYVFRLHYHQEAS